MRDERPEIVDITITAPDVDWLRQHCAMLIERRLAASANIIPTVDSIFRWQGEVHRATEAYAILHSTSQWVDEIVRVTNMTHPYETVHVQATAISVVDVHYARWVAASVDQPQGTRNP